ncbi:hypothetical protein [Acrocarpospora catenulata]|uniref:hypothetical protein n=1 Tax=Acrocarpospora catenulata TaxID=2836182 RepID=UPI001BDB1CB7|nr:hypothetical protein [Acrocarpospora catenulata]
MKAGGTLVGLITVIDLLTALAGRHPGRRTAGRGAGPALFRLQPVLPPEDQP